MWIIMLFLCAFINRVTMNNSIRNIFFLLLTVLFCAPVASASGSDDKEGLDVKEIIFEHLGDGYGWEVPFFHEYRIPLPVIVRAQDGSWHCFSSARLTELIETEDVATGKKHHTLKPVPVKVGSGDKTYTFMLSGSEAHKNKVVELMPVPTDVEDRLILKADSVAVADNVQPDTVRLDGYEYVDGKYYTEYKPWDISISKNVLALLLAAIVVTAMMMSVVRWYRRHGMKAPRKGTAFLELIVEFVYNGVIKSTLGKKAPKYAPYLLTAFFFILTMNLLGLIVIFPGGANLTGNIAITLVLALLTFIMTNVKATKHYWKEILWPDVPIWLKCPLPIMQFIEIFGIFTKPAALCVRLFANMMGGHMIVITLILLIFIFGAFGAAAAGGVTVISIIFTIFMLALDVLVSFIQAYVFTMLSTIFIGLAQEEGHGHDEEHVEAQASVTPAKAK